MHLFIKQICFKHKNAYALLVFLKVAQEKVYAEKKPKEIWDGKFGKLMLQI